MRKAFTIGAALALGVLAGSGLQTGARAQMQSAGTMVTQTTASYRVELDLEPAMMMLMVSGGMVLPADSMGSSGG